jgi:hypothetical protein
MLQRASGSTGGGAAIIVPTMGRRHLSTVSVRNFLERGTPAGSVALLASTRMPARLQQGNVVCRAGARWHDSRPEDVSLQGYALLSARRVCSVGQSTFFTQCAFDTAHRIRGARLLKARLCL